LNAYRKAFKEPSRVIENEVKKAVDRLKAANVAVVCSGGSFSAKSVSALIDEIISHFNPPPAHFFAHDYSANAITNR
jgi:hypothetical protein